MRFKSEKVQYIIIDGSQHWINDYKKHRLIGPAIIMPSGTRFWLKDGLNHRINGPAIIYCSGHKKWYENGVLLNEV
jgi:hypothetical protein